MIMDITYKKEEKQILEKIVAASEEFLQSSGIELNYQQITDNILDISGARYAVFTLFDAGKNKFRTVAVSAPDGALKKVSSLLGFKLSGKEWDHDPVLAEKIRSSTINHFSGLNELSGGVIPKQVISLIEKTFNIGEVVLVKILKDNVLVGDFRLIMSKNTSFKNDDYVKLYTRQVGLFITRSISESRLAESEE